MKIGFIGCGNMGGALIKAASKSIEPQSILIYDRDIKKAQELQTAYKVASSEENTLIKEAKYIFLGVKPQVLEGAIGEIKGILKERKDRFVIVSMAAGVEISKIIY